MRFPRRRLFSLHVVFLLSTSSSCSHDPAALERTRSDTAIKNPSSTSSSLTPEQEKAITRLESLGYIGRTDVVSDGSGVTRLDRERAYPGLTLMNSGHRPEATLMDLTGRVIHRWSCPLTTAFPADARARKRPADRNYWDRVYLFEDGDLLALSDGVGLVRLDQHSRPRWSMSGLYHHDFEVLVDGRIWILKSEIGIDARLHTELPVRFDYVVLLDPERQTEVRRISIYDAFMRSPFASMMDTPRERIGTRQDIFHTNTLEIMSDRMKQKGEAFSSGDFLLSMRTYSIIAVLDPKSETIKWAQSGPWSKQHEPSVLPNGDLLIFDNKGSRQFGRSRIIEYDAASSEIVWRYDGSPDHTFFTLNNGRVQHLPNGNLLITETGSGRAMEITRDHEVVWWYVNPHRMGEEGQIAGIFGTLRLEPDFPVDWLSMAETSVGGLVSAAAREERR